MPWAPPAARKPSAPESGRGREGGCAPALGPAHQTEATPAALAAQAVMIALEGRGNRPPGA